MVRGIEHVGFTVPDVDDATRFFERAFGAKVLYDHLPRGGDPFRGTEAERLLGVPAGTEATRMRMLSMPDGPNIELFEYTTEAQREAVRPCDLGLQHVAFYTDDMRATCDRITQAGGEVIVGPRDFGQPLEAGPGNQWCYTRTPWGTTIELTTFPSPQGYEEQTSARRWRPRSGDD